MNSILEALKYTLLIVFCLCLYSLSLETINSYKAFKQECSTEPTNKHNATETDELMFAWLNKK